MAFLRGVLRVYSWIFEAILCLMGIAISIVSLAASPVTVQLDWLPWSDHAMPGWLIGIGILGLILVILAVVGRLRLVFFLFCVAMFALLFKGLFLGTHTFAGADSFRNAILLVLGSLLAIVGAWPAGAGKAREYRGQ